MKKNTIVIIAIIIVAAIVAVCGIKYAAYVTDRNMRTLFDMPVPNVTVEESTTEAVEETTEIEETTTEVKVKPERIQRYENTDLYRQVGLLASKLPFSFGYPDGVGRVCMYIPTEVRGEDLVWDNTYVVIEHHNDYPVILKLDKADGISVGNIVAKEEMTNANLTFVYFDGQYSQDYTVDYDGDMVILKDFPEDVEEIHIKNRSSNSIYAGEIAGEKVYVNDIVIKIVD